MPSAREKEVDTIISYLDKIPHTIHMMADYTWASKFRSIYKGKMNIPDISLSKLGFIVSRKPIATCYTDKAQTIEYKLGYSHQWRKQVEKMHQFFKYNNIEEVHLDEDISIMKNLFVQVAKYYGVKTIVHMHGALGQKWGFLPLTADKIHVWDERNKYKLMSWGLHPNRIEVEGYSHRYDPILKRLKPNMKPLVMKELKLNTSLKTILFAPYTLTNYGDGFESEIKDGIKMIQQTIVRLASPFYDAYPEEDFYNIIVKLHPSSPDFKYWNKWKKDNLLNVTIMKDYDPFLLAYISDLMVVQSSTYAIDGLVLGKNVITIDTGFTTCVEEYADKFESARTTDELISKITLHQFK